MFTRLNRFIALGLVAFLGVACQTQPPQTTTAPVEDRSSKTDVPPPSAGTAPATSTTQTGRPIGTDPFNDPQNPLSKRSVYFDYDSATVRDEFKPALTAHAKYLADNRGARVRVEGHCDERGTREYNLALGQRRADAVKKMLTLLGAADNQVETVSFGKEKPKNSNHDETAWAENRRGDMVYASR